MKRVLIIGAGGSYPYKFPLGSELFKRIQQSYFRRVGNYLRQVKKIRNIELLPEYKEAVNFCSCLEKIKGISIDKYLNIKPDYLEIGKKAILMEILDCESKSTIENQTDNWLEYLFNRMMSGLDNAESICNNFGKDFAFITFNYDRSLENYFYNNLYSILNHKISVFEIVKLMKSIPIIHVYGKAGYLDWEQPEIVSQITPYGKTDNEIYFHCNLILDMIELIYEKRKDMEEIQKAKNIILNSESVYFLGFGFDQLNLQILGLPNLHPEYKIFATAFTQTDNERNTIKKNIVGESNFKKNLHFKKNIHVEDMNSTLLLRNYYDY